MAEATSSPTVARLRTLLLEMLPRAKWIEYEPTGDDRDRAGTTLAFGRPLRTHWALDRAQIIICLAADPLGSHPAAVRYARDFAAGRRPESGQMSRLYSVESSVTLTGMAADHRLALRPTELAALVAMMERRLAGDRLEFDVPQPVQRFLEAMAADLLSPANRGQSVVCGGQGLPPETLATMHRINGLLGNVGHTVTYTQVPDPGRPSYVDGIAALADEISAGQIDTLFVLGGNPIYNAPADLAFADAMHKVETTIHLSDYRDETSRQCVWHLPRAHFLESWGDGRSYDGTYSVIQPMIAPLTDSRSSIEVLSIMHGSKNLPQSLAARPEDLVRQTYREQIAGTGGEPWRRVVCNGWANRSQWPVERVSSNMQRPEETQSTFAESAGKTLEVIFRADASVYDDRFANNSWLQELPDPLTKLTWDNAACLSPATAERFGVQNETLVTIKVGPRKMTIPAYILPGQAEGTVTLSLGYGRTAAGQVGGNIPEVPPVGVDVYPNQMSVWPNFRSPLLWDVVAISTYGTVSLLFWYLGMIPDLATLRDRASSTWRHWAYGLAALGWRGSSG